MRTVLLIRSAGDHMRVHEDCGRAIASADDDSDLAVIIMNRRHEAERNEPLGRDGQKDQAAKPKTAIRVQDFHTKEVLEARVVKSKGG